MAESKTVPRTVPRLAAVQDIIWHIKFFSGGFKLIVNRDGVGSFLLQRQTQRLFRKVQCPKMVVIMLANHQNIQCKNEQSYYSLQNPNVTIKTSKS